jgi:AcrR family transcriptional regulator
MNHSESPTLLPRGPAALPPEEVAAAHRRRLLTAMAAAVAEKGYAATSIGDVVGRARVSRTAFYRCFADKEEGFLAAYAEQADTHFSLIADAAARAESWLGQLRAGVHAYVRELEAHPAYARSFLIEILAAGPRASELRAAVHDRHATLMRDWYASAPGSFDLPPLADEIFRAAVGATNELVIARLEKLTGRGSSGSTEGAPSLEELVFEGLVGLFRLPQGHSQGPAPSARDRTLRAPSEAPRRRDRRVRAPRRRT